VLVKDLAWSKRLARYAAMLPALQRGLPVPDAYKAETPGTTPTQRLRRHLLRRRLQCGIEDHRHQPADDEQVQLARAAAPAAQNAMRASSTNIMVPIARS